MTSIGRPTKRRRTEADDGDTDADGSRGFLYIKGAPDDGVAAALSAARTRGLLIDADVVSSDGGPAFPAHRVLLASRSEYMKALLGSDRFADSSDRTIRLVDIASPALENLLKWMYGESFWLPSLEDAIDLAEASSRLQCLDLWQMLCNALRKKISVENCAALWALAERSGSNDLAVAVETVAARHFKHLIEYDDMLKSLSPNMLLKLVRRDLLHVDTEEDVFTTIIAWARGQTEQILESSLVKLVSEVRFQIVSTDFFSRKVERESLMKKYPLCADAIADGRARFCKERTDGIKSPALDDLKYGMAVQVISDVKKLKNMTRYAWNPGREQVAGTRQRIQGLFRYGNEVKIGGFYWSLEAIESAEFAAAFCNCSREEVS